MATAFPASRHRRRAHLGAIGGGTYLAGIIFFARRS
jgi:hypothetical protein